MPSVESASWHEQGINGTTTLLSPICIPLRDSPPAPAAPLLAPHPAVLPSKSLMSIIIPWPTAISSCFLLLLFLLLLLLHAAVANPVRALVRSEFVKHLR
jgi:hypothetical protein